MVNAPKRILQEGDILNISAKSVSWIAHLVIIYLTITLGGD